MKNIIEISGSIKNGMWDYTVFPDLADKAPPVRIETTSTVEQDGFFLSKIETASIGGTYLEAASHVVPGGKVLSDYSITDFIRPVKLVRLPRQEPRALISAAELEEYAPPIAAGDAIIVDTGWWRNWNEAGFVDQCPNYDRGALSWIIKQKPAIFGVDVPCIEAARSDEDGGPKGSLLYELFVTGALLAAPLCNLGPVPATGGFIGCFPLPAEDVCGAPARVIYFEE